ncbi:hypothetical protein SODALDRAFT_318753 [Sodiomyces alkalinus F11]|uniref:Uncharacterized protein n=1 Tax=Sodiomyces alkalinus (strain CBS 110278 / VKM F-3762 / F11) TaxID=1314773 RepID=A0A3N2Q5C2_SODAK|nr:hypothetical protein SODALDRAFT_318753 [Sodiomyces alkalinus F11]ROT41970.1 hypothetical protein SODALDRAFT_318753 [Sodiomyces alkalinus F11]
MAPTIAPCQPSNDKKMAEFYKNHYGQYQTIYWLALTVLLLIGMAVTWHLCRMCVRRADKNEQERLQAEQNGSNAPNKKTPWSQRFCRLDDPRSGDLELGGRGGRGGRPHADDSHNHDRPAQDPSATSPTPPAPAYGSLRTRDRDRRSGAGSRISRSHQRTPPPSYA